MVPPASVRVSRVPTYSGYYCGSSDFAYRTLTSFGLLSQNSSAIITSITLRSPQPRSACTSVWPLTRSLAATEVIDVSFSSCPYLDVSVQGVPSAQLCIHCTVTALFAARFPHSDISGSLTMCVSPKLFAAFYVLHRFLMPRHSPFALISFNFRLIPLVSLILSSF